MVMDEHWVQQGDSSSWWSNRRGARVPRCPHMHILPRANAVPLCKSNSLVQMPVGYACTPSRCKSIPCAKGEGGGAGCGPGCNVSTAVCRTQRSGCAVLPLLCAPCIMHDAQRGCRPGRCFATAQDKGRMTSGTRRAGSPGTTWGQRGDTTAASPSSAPRPPQHALKRGGKLLPKGNLKKTHFSPQICPKYHSSVPAAPRTHICPPCAVLPVHGAQPGFAELEAMGGRRSCYGAWEALLDSFFSLGKVISTQPTSSQKPSRL